MMKRKVSRNFIYQVIYQACIVGTPFVLMPYLTRTLFASALGEYTYLNSIALCFTMIAMLGIVKYGQRAISQASVRESALGRCFYSLFAVHIIVSLLVLAVYEAYVLSLVRENVMLYQLELLVVVSALFDVTWFFYGLEDFRKVSICTLLTRIPGIAAVFVFVKSPNDLWKYVLINACMVLAGQIVLFVLAVHSVPFASFGWKDMKTHIKPLLTLWVSVIAVTMYTVFDKTLLGLLSAKENAAFYEYGSNVISLAYRVISIIGIIMYPVCCKLVCERQTDELKRNIRNSMTAVVFIGCGAAFGILGLGQQFAVLYYGEKFAASGGCMIALTPVILILGIGDILRMEYIIPNSMDRQYVICVVLNAVINLTIDILLIPSMGIYGAAAGTIAAELFGLIYQLVISKSILSAKDLLKDLLGFTAAGILMLLSILFVSGQAGSSWGGLFIKTALAFAVYAAAAGIYIVLCKRRPGKLKR